MSASKKFSITWIEFVLLLTIVIGGMGIWTFTEQKIDQLRKFQQPLEIHYQKAADVLSHQAELSSIESEIKTIQSELAEQKIELLRKSQELQTLSKHKADAPITQGSDRVQPSPTKADLDKAKLEVKKIEDLVQALTDELPRETEASIFASLALENAKLKASVEFGQAQASFLWAKRLTTLYYAALGNAALLLGTWIIVTLIGLGRGFKTNRTLVFGSATTLLFLLIGYQVFGFTATSLIAVLIVILLLAVVRGNS